MQSYSVAYVVVFADEPTTGLDSTAALSLFRYLKELASVGQTVIFTLHQPGYRICTELEKLLVLSKGRTLYYGMLSTVHANVDGIYLFSASMMLQRAH